MYQLRHTYPYWRKQMSEERIFELEVIQATVPGQAPCLAIYLVESHGLLAVPREIYRSSDFGRAIVLTRGAVPGYAAWEPGTFTEISGYTALREQIMRVLDPPEPLAKEANELADMMVSHVRTQVEPMPGQYA